MRGVRVLLLAATLAALPVLAEARQDDARLPALFERLQAATSDEQAQRTEQAIWAIWFEAGRPDVDAMMRRGNAAMGQGRHELALERFNAVIEADPQFAEGWNRRATVLYLMGDYEGSVRDIERTLALEPRHFGALSGLGLINMRLERWDLALKAIRAALEIHPRMRGALQNIETIEKALEGQRL